MRILPGVPKALFLGHFGSSPTCEHQLQIFPHTILDKIDKISRNESKNKIRMVNTNTIPMYIQY